MTATPHDRLFKLAFSDPGHAAEFFRSVLPPVVVQHIDFRTSRRMPLGDERALEERRRVLVLARGFTVAHGSDVRRELGLLKRAFQDVGGEGPRSRASSSWITSQGMERIDQGKECGAPISMTTGCGSMGRTSCLSFCCTSARS
jgi:hypothetical protein